MGKAKILNVRNHLQHIDVIIEGLFKYGVCPALEHELRKARVINNGILKANLKTATKRKDIRVGV